MTPPRVGTDRISPNVTVIYGPVVGCVSPECKTCRDFDYRVVTVSASEPSEVPVPQQRDREAAA